MQILHSAQFILDEAATVGFFPIGGFGYQPRPAVIAVLTRDYVLGLLQGEAIFDLLRCGLGKTGMVPADMASGKLP